MDPVDQDSAPDIDVSAAIRTMQIINGALIAGVAVFALVMLGLDAFFSATMLALLAQRLDAGGRVLLLIFSSAHVALTLPFERIRSARHRWSEDG